jgi:hypothetical protein
VTRRSAGLGLGDPGGRAIGDRAIRYQAAGDWRPEPMHTARHEAAKLAWAQMAAFVLGAVTGYLLGPVGAAVRGVLT